MVDVMHGERALPAVPARPARDLTRTRRVFATDCLLDVEQHWRTLEGQGIESPGQSFDFTRIWTETFALPPGEQCYIVAETGGRPLALLALRRVRMLGVTALVPFAGAHVGCNGPLLDRKRYAKLSPEERRDLWAEMKRAASGASLVYLPDVPAEQSGFSPSDLGLAAAGENLYRTQFESWEQCDARQRSRSRRKHDRQQGQKLEAMGAVAFEEWNKGEDATGVLDTMFADRAARFAEQGIAGPFASPCVRAFYRSMFQQGETLTGRLHVLRLDGRIVAVRYNLVHDGRMFCLISSMNTDPALLPGSPGKQILVRMMQSIFAQGISVFDMGAGFSDEKRHWCNVVVPLQHCYAPLTLRGWFVALVHMKAMQAKAALKNNQQLFARLKALRARLAGAKPLQAPADEA